MKHRNIPNILSPPLVPIITYIHTYIHIYTYLHTRYLIENRYTIHIGTNEESKMNASGTRYYDPYIHTTYIQYIKYKY